MQCTYIFVLTYCKVIQLWYNGQGPAQWNQSVSHLAHGGQRFNPHNLSLLIHIEDINQVYLDVTKGALVLSLAQADSLPSWTCGAHFAATTIIIPFSHLKIKTVHLNYLILTTFKNSSKCKYIHQ